MSAPLRNSLLVSATGSYGLDLGATNWRSQAFDPSHQGTQLLAGVSSDFGSLEELLEANFRLLGFVPACAVLALPGTFRNGRLELTNLPWPSVAVDELGEQFGIGEVELINDMQAAQLGAGALGLDQLKLLKEGRQQPGRHRCVLTLSTGVNWSTGAYITSLPLAREGGHIRLAIEPADRAIAALVTYVSRTIGRPASIENLLSGGQGFDHIVNFLVREQNFKPHPQVEKTAMDRRRASQGCGSLATAGAMADEPLWYAVVELYGRLLGYLINQIVVSELVGELVIQGSVLNGTPGFGQWLFANTDVGQVLLGEGMEKSYIAGEVTIYGVPPEIELAAPGAEHRARQLLTKV